MLLTVVSMLQYGIDVILQHATRDNILSHYVILKLSLRFTMDMYILMGTQYYALEMK